MATALNPEQRGDKLPHDLQDACKQPDDPSADGGRETRASKAYDTATCQTSWRRANLNPHASQAAQGRDQLVPINDFVPLGSELPRLLISDMPRVPYRPRPRGELRTIQHWGQRKLLLSEIEFLTHFGSAEFAVLYAGAAPGTHIGYLACTLFPQYSFVLVDPNRFDVSELEGLHNVHIINDFFTSEMAKKFAHLRTLFISDIRTANPHTMKSSEVEVRVKMDNAWQEQWHASLRPRASMLKFRLPYNLDKDPDASEECLDGHAWLPVWGRVQTTETRLVCGTNTARRIWNLQEYEDQCYWFNTQLRPSVFAHSVHASEEGLDHCYDCAAEVEILRQYQLKHISTWMCYLQPEKQKMLEGLPEKVAVVVDQHESECADAGMTLSSVPEDHEGKESTSSPDAAEAEASDDRGAAAASPSAASTACNTEQQPLKPPVEHHRETLAKAVDEARALKCRDAGEPIDEVQQIAPTVTAGSTAPPLLPSLWHELDLDDEQRRLIDERVASMVQEISLACSKGRRPRSLAQITLPTEERGYRFDSNMEGRLQQISVEASNRFTSRRNRRKFGDLEEGQKDSPPQVESDRRKKFRTGGGRGVPRSPRRRSTSYSHGSGRRR